MLLCPWVFPGKNIGVGCHFLLQGSSQPRDRTQVSCIGGRFFTVWTTWANTDRPKPNMEVLVVLPVIGLLAGTCLICVLWNMGCLLPASWKIPSHLGSHTEKRWSRRCGHIWLGPLELWQSSYNYKGRKAQGQIQKAWGYRAERQNMES